MVLSEAFRLEPNSIKVKPTILIKGESGAGKTYSIGSLLSAGYRVCVADMEKKLASLLKYRPLIQPINQRSEFIELMDVCRDPSKRKEWAKRRTNGEWDDIDIVAVDSIGEYVWQLDESLRIEFAGEVNKFKRWDEYGRKIINWARYLRDTASVATTDPIGVVVTMPITFETTNLGMRVEKYPIQGNVAPDRLPQYFDYVLVQGAKIENGKALYYLQTVSIEGITAKGPGSHILPAVVDITQPGALSFADVYTKLCLHLSAEKGK